MGDGVSAVVFDDSDQSRRQNVGTLAESEGNGPRGPTGNRQEQEFCGAPGWNRTSDTRFRKHAAGVMGRGGSCAIVLHGPRFCASSVLGRAQPCCAVARRLVGIAAATPRRPRRQSRAAHGNRGALAPRPAHARLRRAAYPGGPFEDGDHPLPEVLPGT